MSNFNFSATVRPFDKGNFKGFATLIINDTIHIDGVTIVEGRNGLFASAPSEKYEKDGETKWARKVKFFEDTEEGVYSGPIQQMAEQAILDEYARAVAQGGGQSSGGSRGGNRGGGGGGSQSRNNSGGGGGGQSRSSGGNRPQQKTSRRATDW